MKKPSQLIATAMTHLALYRLGTSREVSTK